MKISTFIFKNNLERLAKNGYIYLKVHRKNVSIAQKLLLSFGSKSMMSTKLLKISKLIKCVKHSFLWLTLTLFSMWIKSLNFLTLSFYSFATVL